MLGIVLAIAPVIDGACAREVPTQHFTSEGFTERRLCETRFQGAHFSRTELFFGLSRSGGPDVTEEEFQRFIDTKVTPRFPDGLTLFSGKGQFKDSTGTILQEGSKLLILLYPFNKESHRAIEQIRDEYKKDFQQESVLRVDEQSCVSF
jgi:hypothetical protein